MRTTFRQGIAKYQTDGLGAPIFLQRNGEFVDLLVSPTTAVVLFAHKSADYLVEEAKTIQQAWGPLPAQTCFLYWDINTVSAELTRGFTLFAPITTSVEPPAPAVDQHWFDLASTTMKVWSGSKWIEKIRVFAGKLSSGARLEPMPLGSQVGITGDFEASTISYDQFGKALRNSGGMFVISNGNSSAAGPDEFTAVTAEAIPRGYLIRVLPSGQLALARNTNVLSRAIGLAMTDLSASTSSKVQTDGVFSSAAWSFPASATGRPAFAGADGNVTHVSPALSASAAVLQIVGWIINANTIELDPHQVVILKPELLLPSNVEPEPTSAPTPAFTAIGATTGEAPLTVTFVSQSLGSPSLLEWDFNNDGVIDATGPQVTHTFTEPGAYSVRLKATNANGSRELVKTSFVNIATKPGRTGIYANLGLIFSAPAQARKGESFNLMVRVTNDGYREATHVKRTIIIPDIRGEEVKITSPLPGTTTWRSLGRTFMLLPEIPIMGSGKSYGPVKLSVISPAYAGPLKIFGSATSPETDPTLIDNYVDISVEVR